jgi:hypothetical protein
MQHGIAGYPIGGVPHSGSGRDDVMKLVLARNVKSLKKSE